jgi:glycosyltransferase involved in cell wall biosynthesis
MANILKIQMPDIAATIKTEEYGRPIPDQDISPQPDRKIRVLIVITRLTIGGDTNVVLDIANYLNNHPHFEVSLAVGPVPDYEIDLTHLAYERSIPTTLVPALVNHINPWLNLSALLQLRALMRQGKYDLVHTHSSVAGVVGRLAALTARVPVIVHHVHGWGLGEDLSIGTRVLYLSLERLCARFTERMIAVSRPTIQKGLAHRICQKEKFVLIYNGIHLENFRQQIDEQRVRLELGLDPKCKLVGMIGRLDKQKNPLDFIRAAAMVVKDYPQVQFLIAGDGSLRPECESLINELNLQGRFFLLGFRNDINKILPILTLTVLSSLWEGLPVVFQEAMSAGKPIVANNVDGASDVVVDGETGYLVTPHQPQEMAERILYLLNNDKLCEEMGLTAQRFSERFSSQQMVERIESLYRELLASYDAKSKLKSPQPHKITQME